MRPDTTTAERRSLSARALALLTAATTALAAVLALAPATPAGAAACTPSFMPATSDGHADLDARPDGSLVARGDGVDRWDAAGNPLPTIAPTAFSPAPVGGFRGVAVDGSGNVYVSWGHVYRFDAAGNQTLVIQRGTGTPSLVAPGPLGVDAAGNIVVQDDGSTGPGINEPQRIHRFDASGTQTLTLTDGDGAPFQWLYGVDVDAAGNIYAANRLAERILRYDPTGAQTGSFPVGGFPRDVSVAEDGTRFLASIDGGGQELYDATGTHIGEYPQSNGRYPTRVSLDDDGFWFADPGYGRIGRGCFGPPLPTNRPDALVRRGNGAWAGNDVYNGNGAKQTRSAKVKKGKKATYQAQVQHDGKGSDSFRIKGSKHDKRWKVSYFQGNKNITKAVKAGTFTFTNLWQGQSRTIRVVVQAKHNTKKGHKKVVWVTATSVGDPTARDTVKAVTRRR